ncbi:hypothetical protein MLD38_039296 [Melastoma candidum]|uniref:Uncharacterized protein n=1 Tax=Melastoma candidum TaxID=119954 RepID=A0ACB9L2I4_9MYRT|nr:hypothetical protein MLD38_039296 [Melastoma candidum]
MPSINKLVVPVINAILIICFLSSVKGQPQLHEQEHLCNNKVNSEDSNEEWNISYLLWDLIQQTPLRGYNQHVLYGGYYGVAACDGKLSQEDCNDCLDYANNEIFKSCSFAEGAQMKLDGCRLRYEHYQISDSDW